MPEKHYALTPKERLGYYARVINDYLSDIIDRRDRDIKQLSEAMNYSLMAGGKRIRPSLVLEFNRLARGAETFSDRALPFAGAVELLHTFSLIHDDMPCMDDDDLRRGMPTNHVVFGEATALLAGDALLTEAFRLITAETVRNPSDCEAAAKAAACLAAHAGYKGVCGGQMIDLLLEDAKGPVDDELILKMYTMKTSDLLAASCAIGCISAKRYDLVPEAEEFGRSFGIAFQITDDILDVTGDVRKIGKPVGSDEKKDKNTYLKYAGMEKAKEKAYEYAERAKSTVTRFRDNGLLLYLCDKVLTRDR